MRACLPTHLQLLLRIVVSTSTRDGVRVCAERMFEQGMGHEDDLATWRRHRYYQEQEQEQLYEHHGRSGAMRRSPGR